MSYKVKHSFYTPVTFSSSCTLHKGWWCSNTCQTLPSEACSEETMAQLSIFISITQFYRIREAKWQISLEKRGLVVQKHGSYHLISGSADAGHMTCPRSYGTMHSVNPHPPLSQHHMTRMSFQEDNLINKNSHDHVQQVQLHDTYL